MVPTLPSLPPTNSLNALAQAINTSGAGVSATVINLGSPSAPSYTLSLQSTALGNIPIQLNDGTQDLLTTSLYRHASSVSSEWTARDAYLVE